jgi:hypothetical protein
MCETPRYKLKCKKCTQEGNEACTCSRPIKIPQRILYYFPIENRLAAIANSVYSQFLNYDEYRFAPHQDTYMMDIFDGERWKWFQDQMSPGQKFIGLSCCWDGADIFNYSGKSMWATQICILNLPPSLRNKLWFGLHVTCLDSGSDAGLNLLAQELDYLWRVGFYAKGLHYRVGLISSIFDGRGLEKAMKTQGAGSLHGCNLCSFPGMRFGGACVYPGYRRYLPTKHPLRKSCPMPDRPLVQYHCTESRLKPQSFDYSQYEAHAKEVMCSTQLEIGGVKGLWELSDCGYAEHIHITKDSMHAADGFIKDAISSMLPNSGSFINRTTKPRVLADMEALNLQYPLDCHPSSTLPSWILTKDEVIRADEYLDHIFGCPQYWIPKGFYRNPGKVYNTSHIVFETYVFILYDPNTPK